MGADGDRTGKRVVVSYILIHFLIKADTSRLTHERSQHTEKTGSTSFPQHHQNRGG